MIIAVVIPAVFNSFGMESGGRFLRRLFDGYSHVTVGILLFLCAMSVARFFFGHHSSDVLFPVSIIESVLLGAMLVVTVFIIWVLGPQAVALQEQAFEATSELEKTQAYEQFFRLHMIVRALHLCNVGLAAGLFILKLKKGLTLQRYSH